MVLINDPLLLSAQAIAEALDPYLKKKGWSPIEDHAPFVPLHVGLTVLGYHVQKTHQGKFPLYIERFLTPLTLAEGRLKALGTIFKK